MNSLSKLLKRIVLLIIFAVVTTYAGNQRPSVQAGFGTGQSYIEMTENDRRFYAIGALNGMSVAPLLGAPSKDVAWLDKCIPRMTDSQVAAILTKYIREHPNQWHLPLNILTFEAMSAACNEIPK